MKVVSNTTPLSSLSKVGALWLLPALFNKIHIADADFKEAKSGDIELPNEEFTVHDVRNVTAVEFLLPELDMGEAETIVLAKEIQADVVIIDERLGNKIAREAELNVVGTLTILRFAKERGLIDVVRPIFDAMIANGQWYSHRVYEEFLKSIGEL